MLRVEKSIEAFQLLSGFLDAEEDNGRRQCVTQRIQKVGLVDHFSMHVAIQRWRRWEHARREYLFRRFIRAF